MPIGQYLNGERFDRETTRVMGLAFEIARVTLGVGDRGVDEMIAKRIIELAKAGERNVEVLCEAALNAPAGAVSAPNPPPLPA
jgi:hypothetical protein